VGVIFGANPPNGHWSTFFMCFTLSHGNDRGARGVHVPALEGRNGLVIGGLGRSVLGPLLIGPELF
jgi:hypothetical protein